MDSQGGVFKYAQIEVRLCLRNDQGTDELMDIITVVRGSLQCESHKDILDTFVKQELNDKFLGYQVKY